MVTNRHRLKITVLALSVAALSGCNSMTALNLKQQQGDEGIGYREVRFDEISQQREYQQCRDEAFEMDRKAMSSASAGGYLTSARLLEKCESRLTGSGEIDEQQRMQGYALSVQNYMKAGDLDQARVNLTQFKQTFPDQDLYYPDGTSFIETMEVLLGQANSTDYGFFSVLNVNTYLKSEMGRQNYWKHN